MLILYDQLESGNGYKVRLLLAQLDVTYLYHDVDIFHGESRTPEFLAKNPNGRIPVLQISDDELLAESDAILWYLAEGTAFLPAERLPRAQVLQWMFFEQYSHEPYVATSRFIARYLPADSPRRSELPQRLERGRDALRVMEGHLTSRSFFVSERYTIADIALYAYTHVAGEGGLNLVPFPAVRAWIDRVAAQPQHVRLNTRPVTR
jgi:glutathione S-transferase